MDKDFRGGKDEERAKSAGQIWGSKYLDNLAYK